MIWYLAQRLLQAVGVMLGVTVITFLLVFLLPADPARMIAGRSATPATVASIRSELGLDRPLPVQYVSYVKGLVTGKMGRSYAQKAEVTRLIRARLLPTVQLALAGIVFELLIGLPAGIMAALKRGTGVDQTVMALAFVGVSAPQFVVGLLLIYFLSYLLPIFPLGGYGTPLHVILPAITVGLAGGGWYARVTRSAMIEVLRQDYVRTARAKGVFPTKVVFKHVLKNAVLPVVALVGLDIGVFMGGIVIVESVFGWPGIGQMIWQAIQLVDIPVIMGGVIVTALFVVVGNLLADLVYPALDPRIRYS
ncbi:MAG: ABC transporter permease [Truepera sp.]|jgi:peptide/nickel transport system permease protein|nr:ABC transporter permease [Truepera sp.]HRQ10771.1 ABC transporter permease [Trueperaceae bacterium]